MHRLREWRCTCSLDSGSTELPWRLDQRTQTMQICQGPKPGGLEARVHVCIHLLLLPLLLLPSPPNSPQCWALRARKGCTCRRGEEEHVERAHHLLYRPLRPSSLLPSLLSFTLSLLKSITLSSCSRPAVNSPRIIVSMKGSNSERQFQQQYNNTGTPPLWAPILSSVTPLCPSDTSGVSLQRLHQHTHTHTQTHTHTHTHMHITKHMHTLTHTQLCTNKSTYMNTCVPDGHMLHYLDCCVCIAEKTSLAFYLRQLQANVSHFPRERFRL